MTEVHHLCAGRAGQLVDAGLGENFIHREAVVAAAVRLADGDLVAAFAEQFHHGLEAREGRHHAGAIDREGEVGLEEDAPASRHVAEELRRL